MLQLPVFRSIVLCCAAGLAFAAAGCSTKAKDAGATAGEDAGVALGQGTDKKEKDAGTATDGVAASGDAVTAAETSGGATEGAVCKADGDCASQLCAAKRCTRYCNNNAECGQGSECATDDGIRAFCRKPTYTTGMGEACYMGAACADGLKCMGDPGSVRAVCSATCDSTLDCPATMECLPAGGDHYCLPRRFCSACATDEQCGAGSICTDMGLGVKFCSKECHEGSLECPRFADCNPVDDTHFACMHRAGTCIGGGDLCEPCADEACLDPSPGCLTFPSTGENFCSKSCASSAECGTGFKCAAITATVKGCVPNANRCVGKLTKLYEKGDIFEDYAMLGRVDTNDDGSLKDEEPRLIHLSDFADKELIGITVSAGWCVPCQQETKTFAATLNDPALKGRVTIFQILVEDADQGGGKIDLGFSLSWIKQFGAVGASGIDPDRTPDRWNEAGSIPLNIVISGKDRKVLENFNGSAPGGWTPTFKKYIK